MMKKVSIVIGILVAIPILFFLGIIILINPIVRIAVEKGGSAALKVPTHLEQATVGLPGSATLSGFEIANPQGYSGPRAVAFEKLESSVAISSLFGPVVQVETLTIVKPELSLEFSGTKSNWSVLMDNLSAGKSPSQEPPKESDQGKKFIIHKLRIEGGRANFRSNAIPGGGTTVPLPPIELENIGTAEGGASMSEILTVVLKSMGNSAFKAGQGVVPSDLLNSLGASVEDGAKKFKEAPGQSVEQLKKKPEKLQERVPKSE